MEVVLGIDAAWTMKNPSGVALVKKDGRTWQCIAIAPSYDSFIGMAAGIQVDWQNGRFKGSKVNVSELVIAAEKLAGAPVGVVTIDMPMSRVVITGRRVADDMISSAFGSFYAATHTPSIDRPGEIGKNIKDELASHEFELITTKGIIGAKKPLLEVYPHPAIIHLLNLSKRLKYKASKSSKYWPEEKNIENRIEFLMQNLKSIYDGLCTYIDFIKPHGHIDMSVKPTKLSELKPLEDALDALVCAWVGICYLNGKAEHYGDETAAIWIPTHDVSVQTKKIHIKE